MEKHIIGENGIAYTLGGERLHYLDLKLSGGTYYEIEKYGLMRWEYLKNHHRWEYIRLLMDGKLNEYLHQVDEECYEMLDSLTEQMKSRQGVTEQLKVENMMLWVGRVNNIRASAEEGLWKNLVYV